MKHGSLIVTRCLLVIGFIFFGCSQQTSGQDDAGWITLIDGPRGLENWN